MTLYQLVSGNIPWSADTLPELAIKIAVDPAPPLPPAAGVPPAFERIIQRCLEKDPGLRFQTVTALAEALGPFAPDGGAAVGRVRRAGGPATGPPGSTTLQSSAGEVAGEGGRGRARVWGVVGGLMVAAAVAVGAIVAARGSTKAIGDPPVVAASPDVRPIAVVVAATPDAAPATVVVAATPDAAPAVVVAATPDAAVATTTHVEAPEDRYTTLIKEARAKGRGSCAAAVRRRRRPTRRSAPTPPTRISRRRRAAT